MPPGTRVMTPPTGESYTFDPGCFSLELLLTGGPGIYEQWEILHEPADLASWLVVSRLAAPSAKATAAPATAAPTKATAAAAQAVSPKATAAAAKAAAAKATAVAADKTAPAKATVAAAEATAVAAGPLREADFRIRPAELRRIVQFRDTFLSVALAITRGERPSTADLEVINFAAGPGPVPRIDPKTLTHGWQTPITGAQVLGAAAADAIEQVASASSGRVRMCAGDNCLLLFLDTSRPGNRRWCSMQRCGNRNKVHTFRAKN